MPTLFLITQGVGSRRPVTLSAASLKICFKGVLFETFQIFYACFSNDLSTANSKWLFLY